MTAIVWDDVNERPYELGVDRGLLCLDTEGGEVIPWNGIVSIDESEIDVVELRSHFDGVTYANFQFGESYKAKIEAYGFPYEFSSVLGLQQPFPGLSLTAQPRTEFNLSYRTMIGEDHYKIHFVYNLIAQDGGRKSNTISDDVDVETFAWNVTAIPPDSTTFRPTAHVIIDTVNVDDPVRITVLEGIVYGTDVSDPNFPTIDELIAFYAL